MSSKYEGMDEACPVSTGGKGWGERGLLRARNVLSLTPEGRLAFESTMLEGILADAQTVLHEQVRNSILQVVHR